MSRYLVAFSLACISLSVTDASAIPLPAITSADCVVVKGPASFTGNRLQFKSGRTGTIVANCAIDQDAALALTTENFVVTYRDSTATSQAGHVKVRLVQVSFAGVPFVSQKFNSNLFAATEAQTEVGTQLQPLAGGQYYMLQVELKRTKTTQKVEFFGAFSKP